MRSTQFSFVCACLFVGCLLFVSAAPAAAQIHCSQCTCSDPCSTACFYLERINTPEGPDFEQVNTTCGGYGNTCVGASGCPVGPTCKALACTTAIYGTSGNDTLNGTSARECIYGYAGNDTIDGYAGDDKMWGDDGTDTIFGDSGNDCMWGGNQNDNLDGETGDDYANGQGGSGDTCTAEGEENCEY